MNIHTSQNHVSFTTNVYIQYFKEKRQMTFFSKSNNGIVCYRFLLINSCINFPHHVYSNRIDGFCLSHGSHFYRTLSRFNTVQPFQMLVCSFLQGLFLAYNTTQFKMLKKSIKFIHAR